MTSLEAEMLPTTSRTNWIENNNIPDSINTNIRGRSGLPPVTFEIRSSSVGLTARNTLKILYTIRLVATAFTIIDMARPVVVSGLPQ